MTTSQHLPPTESQRLGNDPQRVGRENITPIPRYHDVVVRGSELGTSPSSHKPGCASVTIGSSESFECPILHLVDPREMPTIAHAVRRRPSPPPSLPPFAERWGAPLSAPWLVGDDPIRLADSADSPSASDVCLSV